MLSAIAIVVIVLLGIGICFKGVAAFFGLVVWPLQKRPRKDKVC